MTDKWAACGNAECPEYGNQIPIKHGNRAVCSRCGHTSPVRQIETGLEPMPRNEPINQHWSGLTPAEQSDAANEAAQERKYREAEREVDRRLSELQRIGEEFRKRIDAAHAEYEKAEDHLEKLRRERYPEVYAEPSEASEAREPSEAKAKGSEE